MIASMKKTKVKYTITGRLQKLHCNNKKCHGYKYVTVMPLDRCYA